MIWYARGKKTELISLLKVQQDLEEYADEWKPPACESKKWRKLDALGSLIREHVSFVAQFEELDWRVHRKKKIWKT